MWPRSNRFSLVFVPIGLGVWPKCSGLAVQPLRRDQLRWSASAALELERWRRAAHYSTQLACMSLPVSVEQIELRKG
jgi:hypothetical protein